MFLAFYHLREQPFGTNPDPRFLYQSNTHREALSSLLYRIQTDSGFLAMVAQPGMGKTTLLFHLLRRLQPMARTAFIFQTQCTSHELLRQLLSEFECDISITDPVRISQELKSVLVAEANAGRRCVVLIDEAQNLTSEVLETVRLLSDFETPQRKLLQIILSGQNELGETLGRTGLQQLRQRLSCIVRIQRFTPKETALYIAHRLGVAGHAGKLSEIFSLGALARIAQLSEGVPRVINNICFNSLSLGFALERKQIDGAIIEEVAADLGLSYNASPDRVEEERQVSASIAAAFNEQEHEDVQHSSPEPEVDSSLKPGTSLRPLPASMAAQEATGTHTPVKLPDLPSETQPDAAVEVGGLPAIPPLSVSAGLSSATEADPVKHRKPFFMRMRARVHDARRGRTTIFLGLAGACALVLWVADAIDTPAPRAVLVRQAVISEKSFLPVASVSSPPIRQVTAASRKSRPQLAGTGAVATPTALQQKRSSSLGTSLHEDSFRARKIWKAPQNSELPIAPNSALLTPSHLAPPTSRVVPLPITSSIPPNRVASPSLIHPSSTSGASAGIYLPPKAIWHPAPNYPELALSSKTAGDVLLLLSVSSDGTVERVKVVKGSADLVAAAESAVKQWKYSPALSNGRPVDSEAFATLRFRMY